MIRTKRPDLIHSHFFFVDIVGLSNPKISSTIQLKKLENFHKIITSCETLKETPKQDMISFPTGDGMCVGFTKDPELPILLAMQLQQKLFEYNKGKIPNDLIQTRIGIHSGPCYYFDDDHGWPIVWGPGVIIAKRIMDLGNANHILLGSRIAEDLQEISDEYRNVIHPLQDYLFKHNVKMLVYSAFGQDFGNSNLPPVTFSSKNLMFESAKKIQETALYPKISVELEIIPENMLVLHKRTYHIQNNSETPIEYVIHGIGTDVEKPLLSDLKVKTYDNTNSIMKISSVTINEPFSKEFSTVFEKPVTKDDKQRSYTLEYQVEEPERFFENNFAVDCNEFKLSISFPKDTKYSPILYNLNPETEEKTKNKTPPQIISKDTNSIHEWNFKKMARGKTLRLEW